MELFSLTPLEAEALRLSLWVSLWAVAGSLPLGILAAWVLARGNFPGKALLDGIIHLPLVLPPVVIGYLLLVLLGRKGMLGAALYNTFGISFAFNWKGAAVASAVVAFPLLVRDSPFYRFRGPGIGGCRPHSGRGSCESVLYDHDSSRRSRDSHWGDPRLCQKPE